MAEVEEMIDYIVPTFNSAATLKACIQSIYRFGEPNSIIIIDNNSTDETMMIALEMGCKIHQGAYGIGPARRLGAKLAGTDRIAFVDSDVELQASWQKVLDSPAPIVSGYYEAFHQPLPHVARRSAGFIACCIMDRKLILDCEKMDTWDYGEDSRFARWLDSDWLIVNAECIHHQEDSAVRWRKYGRELRRIDGLTLGHLKRIIGGALLGYRMGTATDYISNFKLRLNYLWGYLYY